MEINEKEQSVGISITRRKLDSRIFSQNQRIGNGSHCFPHNNTERERERERERGNES